MAGGSFWSILGAILEDFGGLGGPRGHLGVPGDALVHLGSLLEGLWGALGGLWEPLGGPGSHLGAPGSHLGIILGTNSHIFRQSTPSGTPFWGSLVQGAFFMVSGHQTDTKSDGFESHRHG